MLAAKLSMPVRTRFQPTEAQNAAIARWLKEPLPVDEEALLAVEREISAIACGEFREAA